MKKYFARYLPLERRDMYLQMLSDGQKVTVVSRNSGISRTTLYSWLKKQYLNKLRIVPYQRGSHKKLIVRRRIVRLAIMRPGCSIREISRISGYSVGFVWKCLKIYSLNDKISRSRHISRKGGYLYKFLTPSEKSYVLSLYYSGASISKICNEYHISRTIFYSWLKKYSQAGNEVGLLFKIRPRGEHHWRFIEDLDKSLLSVVSRNPSFSLSKIHQLLNLKRIRKVSRSGVYYRLRALRLNKAKYRIAYARSASRVVRYAYEALNIQRPINKKYSYLSYLSPPLRNGISLFLELVIISYSSCILAILIIMFNINMTGFRQDPIFYDERRALDVRGERETGILDTIYIVQHGDTLWGISEMIFGNGYNWPDIAYENKLEDPDYIEIEQELVIPIVEPRLKNDVI